MTPTPTHTAVQPLPCPYCGHPTAPQLATSADLDENWDDSNVPYYAVFCDASNPGGRGGCGASGGFAPTEAEAVERWNRRASLPVVQGEQPLSSSVASESQPLAQANSQDGNSVVPPVEPPGATLQPCAASQWVSVDERLPPLNTEVLIAFDTSPLPATGQLTMYRGIRQWCWPAENDPVGDESLRAVTHWAFMRHPNEIGEWASQVERGESSSEGGAS